MEIIYPIEVWHIPQDPSSLCALESFGANYLFIISTRTFLQLKRSIIGLDCIIVTVSELFNPTVEYDTGDVKGNRCVGVCVCLTLDTGEEEWEVPGE